MYIFFLEKPKVAVAAAASGTPQSGPRRGLLSMKVPIVIVFGGSDSSADAHV